MGVCDEGWSQGKPWYGECPCLIVPDRAYHYCALGQYTRDDTSKNDFTEPTTCPYAPILKLLVEAEEVGDYKVLPHDPRDPDDWDLAEFWIRRKP